MVADVNRRGREAGACFPQVGHVPFVNPNPVGIGHAIEQGQQRPVERR